jgi:signal transduction histidine kinase
MPENSTTHSDEIEQVRRESRQYLQNVAHQLTAPLGAIKWSIEAIKDQEIPIQRKMSLLSSVYSQATILVHLIKNFALMSNLEADHELGEFRDKPDLIDVHLLCINLANDFQPQGAEADKSIEVVDDSFYRTLGLRKLQIVKNLVAQAISNLLENAVKYSEGGTKITISADRTADGIGLVVRSMGLIIKQEEIPLLCNRSYRGSEAKKRVPPGTGIGLYLAKRIMDMHGGRVEVLTEGRVSSFVLRFPTSRAI